MNVVSRGIRNAFRNVIRSVSLIVILGLISGLSLAMLVAHQAVNQKISSVKASIGNTITIAPAGFSGFSQVNNALTTSQLSKVQSLPHITGLSENLTDRLNTIGSSLPSFGFDQNSNTNSNNQTSLTSPITFNSNGNGSFSSNGGGGGRLFIAGGGQLPANFSPPISIEGTTDPSSLNGTTVTLSSGQTISGTTDSDNALVSSSMASKNNLKVGSTFTAYGTTLTVSGIFNTSISGIGNTVVVSLPAEQRLSGQSGDVTNAVATVDSLDNLTSATNAIKNSLGSAADVTSSEDQANQAVQPLNSVKSVSLYSLMGAVIAAAVIILLTMIMIVRERRREIGVLKAVGASNLKVMGQFMVEATTLTLLGAVIGILLGALAGNPITRLLVNNSSSSNGAGKAFGAGFGAATQGAGVVTRTAGGGFGRGANFIRNNFSSIHAAVGWSILIYGLLAAIVIGVVGSGLASFFIAKIRPAEVMRAE